MDSVTRDEITILLERESKYYACDDYLSDSSSHEDVLDQSISYQHLLEECANVVTDQSFAAQEEKRPDKSPVSVAKSPSVTSVRDLVGVSAAVSVCANSHFATWRQQMFDWSCNVMDSYGTSREAVAVAFSILDRYIAKEILSEVPISREDFQLFCMTSLYIAVKVGESYRKLPVSALIDMSRAYYSKDDIQSTEQDILATLNWHVHPPTASTCYQIFSRLFPEELSFATKITCQSLAEKSVADPFFLSSKASSIGLATLLIAARQHNYSEDAVAELLENCKGLVDLESKEFLRTYHHLQNLCYP